MKTVTVLGGYGTFGSRISSALTRHPDTSVRVVGRDPGEGGDFAGRIGADFRCGDVADGVSLRRAIEGSHIVIHAAGPFQEHDYRVAEMCVECGSHYLDLADARLFVAGISRLDEPARRRGLFVSSGVSSVPAITHAMIGALSPEFASIDEIHGALSPGNQNPRGAATIGAILTYVGRPIPLWQGGRWIPRPGWGDARRLDFPSPVGRRRVHNCDVPDLELFPKSWGASTVRFHAGVELSIINYALSGFAWLRKFIAMDRLHEHAGLFLRLSLLLSRFGTKNGSLAVWLRGTGHDGAPLERRIAIVTNDDGPATPSSAS
ncbi:MAG: saccharopine dehydrogenase NADP-binding domain-containing protein, partial [Candidatus Hydrogenedentota bacterium]